MDKLNFYNKNKERIKTVKDYIRYFNPDYCGNYFTYLDKDGEVIETRDRCSPLSGYCLGCLNKFKEDFTKLKKESKGNIKDGKK